MNTMQDIRVYLTVCRDAAELNDRLRRSTTGCNGDRRKNSDRIECKKEMITYEPGSDEYHAEHE